MRSIPARFAPLAAALASLTLLAPAYAHDRGRHQGPPPEPVSCAELATDPDNGLLGAGGVKSVNSQVIAAAGTNAAY